jgi:hypothetical protein
MYGVTKSNLIKGTGYSYLEQIIEIPRCEGCSNKQKKLTNYIEIPIFIVVFSFTVWYVVCELFGKPINGFSFIPGIGLGLIVATFITSIIKEISPLFIDLGKLDNDIKDSEKIKIFLRLGWKMEKPAKDKLITDKDLIKGSHDKK